MSDLIERQVAIDAAIEAVDEWDGGCSPTRADMIADAINNTVPSAQSDLIAKIQNGIKLTDVNDNYSCGMRNGMRWCMSLVDDKEPLFENCPSAQPELHYDEWCTDCKEYDRERHCCPRWNKVIRQTLKDAQQSQWIPCNERLPEDSSPVLITHRGGVSYGWYNGRYFERGANTNHRKLQTVIAWMPLPKPYQEEGE